VSSLQTSPTDIGRNERPPSATCAQWPDVVGSQRPRLPRTDTVSRPILTADTAVDTPEIPRHGTHTVKLSNRLQFVHVHGFSIPPFFDVNKYVASLIFFVTTASLLKKNDYHFGKFAWIIHSQSLAFSKRFWFYLPVTYHPLEAFYAVLKLLRTISFALCNFAITSATYSGSDLPSYTWGRLRWIIHIGILPKKDLKQWKFSPTVLVCIVRYIYAQQPFSPILLIGMHTFGNIMFKTQ